MIFFKLCLKNINRIVLLKSLFAFLAKKFKGPAKSFFTFITLEFLQLLMNSLYMSSHITNVQLDLVYCVDLVTPNMTQFSRLTQFLKVQLSKLSNFAKRFCISHLNVTFVDTVLSQLKLQTLQ